MKGTGLRKIPEPCRRRSLKSSMLLSSAVPLRNFRKERRNLTLLFHCLMWDEKTDFSLRRVISLFNGEERNITWDWKGKKLWPNIHLAKYSFSETRSGSPREYNRRRKFPRLNTGLALILSRKCQGLSASIAACSKNSNAVHSMGCWGNTPGASGTPQLRN